jgi:aminoacylase
VARFKEFLRIRSISGEGADGAYAECAEWLCKQGEEIGLKVEVVEPVKNKPVVTMLWEGTDPSLPCLILNSHYDVVPVVEEMWHVDAFGAEEKDGRIYGRGTQDMKSVCVQYLEAIRALKSTGTWAPLRTLRLVFVPDEEIGGQDGMGAFLKVT